MLQVKPEAEVLLHKSLSHDGVSPECWLTLQGQPGLLVTTWQEVVALPAERRTWSILGYLSTLYYSMCITSINNASDDITDASFEESTPPVADSLQVHDEHHQEMTAFWKKRRQLNRGVQQGRLPERFQPVSQQKSNSIGFGTSLQNSTYYQEFPSHTHAQKRWTGSKASNVKKLCSN